MQCMGAGGKEEHMLKQLQLFEEEPEPTSTEAEIATQEFELHIDALLEDVNRITFKILVWGPSVRSRSAVAEKRRDIHRKLVADGHTALFSEQFPKRPRGISLKSYELAQARAADMIVMLVEAAASGVQGEVHDFCSHRELLPKILIFYPEDMRHTYGGQGLIQDLDKGFRIVQWYSEIDITSCRVLTTTLEWVQARRSYQYSNAQARSGD